MTRHERRYVKRQLGQFTGICVPAGEKRSYPSRADAKAAAQRHPDTAKMSAFPCEDDPAAPPHYHIGHLPPSVRNGTVSKAKYLGGKPRVRMTTEADGMAVLVRYEDPKDVARICDALLVAAEAAQRAGKPSLVARYVAIANATADAADRAPLPPCNPTPTAAREGRL